jgi:hypothetical protein
MMLSLNMSCRPHVSVFSRCVLCACDSTGDVLEDAAASFKAADNVCLLNTHFSETVHSPNVREQSASFVVL